MSSQTTTPMNAAAPSMRTPTQAKGHSETTIHWSDRGYLEPGNDRQVPSSLLAKERYRAAEFGESGGEEQGFDDLHSGNTRVLNDTDSRRPITRRDSYPQLTEGRVPPVLSHSRRGSTTSTAIPSGRVRGRSFYDAREHMKSGRPVRPDSWHGGAPPPSWYYKDQQSPTTPTTPSRNRVTSANVEDGIPPDEPPSSPSPHGGPVEKVPGNVQWAIFMNSSFKNHLVAAIGEIVGTTMFLFFAFAGTAVANVNSSVKDNTTTNETTGFDPQKLLYISLSFGFSLMVNVWIFFRISGGLFNPAVTLALFLTGAIGFVRAVLLCLSQFVGAIIASALLLGLFPAKINVRTTLSKGLSMQRGVFIEAFLTAELVFCILMLAKEKHKATFIAPIGIGLALFIAELAGVYWTGGSLNPARSIGPCIVTWTWDSTHWVYWVGPLIGSLMAVLFYKFIKMMEYEMANPGQDADIFNDPTKNPYHNVRERQRIVTERVLRSLGYDPNPGFYGHTSIERMEGLGSIELYHNKTPGSLHAGSGNAPWFGPLGTPIRKSEDDAYRIAPPGSAGSAEQGPMRHN